MNNYDVIVVGAGLSGAVMAERMASQSGKKVLVLEQRTHVAGNCFDYQNEHGILVHQYGPHLFHTSKEDVWAYLSSFTDWTAYEHEVLTSVNDKLVPLPFNLNTLHALYTKEQAVRIEALLTAQYGDGGKVPILELRKSDDPELRELAEFVYDRFFVNYTTKQWGCKPEDIAPAVTARVPVVISRDNRYFHDKYQALPTQGYTHMVSNILRHENIDVRLNTDAKQMIQLDPANRQILLEQQPFAGQVVFTGMLDQLFDYVQGELPYRSLQFKFETLECDFYQPATTVNYPNDFDFTRITEFKHFQSVASSHTTIVREFPQDYDRFDPNCNVPYYPVFNDANQARYQSYRALADQFENLICLGRLADYKYYNMDDAVANALNTYTRYVG